MASRRSLILYCVACSVPPKARLEARGMVLSVPRGVQPLPWQPISRLYFPVALYEVTRFRRLSKLVSDTDTKPAFVLRVSNSQRCCVMLYFMRNITLWLWLLALKTMMSVPLIPFDVSTYFFIPAMFSSKKLFKAYAEDVVEPVHGIYTNSVCVVVSYES